MLRAGWAESTRPINRMMPIRGLFVSVRTRFSALSLKSKKKSIYKEVKLINHLSADPRLTKQAIYVQRNNEVRSRNHCRGGKQCAFCVLSVCL